LAEDVRQVLLCALAEARGTEVRRADPEAVTGVAEAPLTEVQVEASAVEALMVEAEASVAAAVVALTVEAEASVAAAVVALTVEEVGAEHRPVGEGPQEVARTSSQCPYS
jgi:hypothetical protein